jgi:hypothetical protein
MPKDLMPRYIKRYSKGFVTKNKQDRAWDIAWHKEIKGIKITKKLSRK